MKSIYKYLLIIFIATSLFSCEEEQMYGEGNDINFPASIITSFEPLTAYVGSEVKVLGEKLDLINRIQIGNIDCEIVSKNETELVFNVARTADREKISITNLYSRVNISNEYFTPEYYASLVTSWPIELEREGTFSLVGENMDLILEVKVGTQVVNKQGAVTPGKVTYSLEDVVLDGESAIITVTDKSGQTFVSDDIAIVAPSTTYIPSKTLLLANFEDVMPKFIDGWGADPSSYTSELNGAGVTPMFGDYWSVTSPAGNGWDGCFRKIVFDNDGTGFDLSCFKKPYITFLVNTNGKNGYFNVCIDGKDVHFKGQDGEYTDDYKFHTDSWEWRSYDLTKLGFDVSGTIPGLEFWARGGNVSSKEPFEVSLDQVMITDGPLQPVLVTDMETQPTVYAGTWNTNSGSGISLIPQATSYFTVKAQVDKAWASVLGGISVDNIDCSSLTNSMYLNFLVNTGTTAAGGYFQMVFVQDGYEYVKHFYGNEAYEDNYSFNTNGEWQWRSWYLNFDNWNWNTSGAPGFDLTKPFSFNVECKSGNIGVDKGNSGEFELNLDYIIFTGTPIDNK